MLLLSSFNSFPFQPAEFTTLPLGEENSRYTDIKEYFNACRKKCSSRVIFPIRPVLAVEEYLKDIGTGSSHFQEKCHLNFLAQFESTSGQQPLPSKSAPHQLRLWQDPHKQVLPREIHSLYYFAFLAHVLFSGGERSPFPQKLDWYEGVDDKGKKALVFSDEDKKRLFANKLYRSSEESRPFIDEPRFESMGIELDRGSFIPIFNREFQSLTTNQAICQRIEDREKTLYKISEATYRELLRITRQETLRVGSAILWLSTNLILLDHPGIQMVLEHCFFGPSGVQHRLKQEPQLLHALRECIKKGLNYYRNNPHHLSAILFLTRMGICIESHAIATLGKTDNTAMLEFYERVLKQILTPNMKDERKSEVLLYLFFLDTLKDPVEVKDPLKVIVDAFKLLQLPYSHKFSAKWLQDKIPILMRNFAAKYQKELYDDDIRDRLCNAILQAVIPESGVQPMRWVGKYPYFRSDNYDINLMTLTVTNRTSGKLSSSCANLFLWDGTYGAAVQKQAKKFWQNGKDHVSLDGKLIVQFQKDRQIIKREIEFEGEKRWFYIHQFNAAKLDEQKLSFLNYPELLPYLNYIPVDRKATDPEILILDRDTDIPVLRVDGDAAGELHFTKLDEKGKSLPIRLVNLTKVQHKQDPTLQASHPICSG